ncbi:MAG: hypothetical protein JXR60_02125 [Bacteroidales bacterium]|nr:hypothetical protein [Bacteroidales bacterium]
MKQISILLAVVSVALFASCGNQQPSADELNQEVVAPAGIDYTDVQGSWELESVEGTNFEMYKGTVLKFDEDVMYYTQNTNEKMGTFFVKDGELHYTYQGLNEVTEKVSIVDGKLQLINGADQIFTYKKIQ